MDGGARAAAIAAQNIHRFEIIDAQSAPAVTGRDHEVAARGKIRIKFSANFAVTFRSP
jgi:hypothetical protein